MYAQDSLVTPALVDRYYDLARRPGNRAAALGRVTAREPDRWGEIGRVRAPTLVMWGAEDRWIPPALVDTFVRAIPGARGVVYRNAGHLPMEERPADTAADARRFLLDPLPPPPLPATPLPATPLPATPLPATTQAAETRPAGAGAAAPNGSRR